MGGVAFLVNNLYEHTVYSTLEMSIFKIKRLPNEAAKYIIETLTFFSVLHFEGISEQILERAWKTSRGRVTHATDPQSRPLEELESPTI